VQAFKELPPIVTVIFISAIFVNPLSIQNIVTYTGGGVAPVTGNPHYITVPARDFLASLVTTQDVLISDVVFKYDNITGSKLHPGKKLRFTVFATSIYNPSISSAIEESPHGWVAVSPNAKPESKGFQFADFMLDGKQLHYIGQIGDIYIWHWSN
jgi:hypothetical protein